MQSAKKIFLVVPSLHRGGAERVISILANNINRSLFDVTLVLLEKRGSFLEDLKKNVKIIDLNTKGTRKSFMPLIKVINKERPDLVLSTLGHLNILMMLIKPFINKHVKFVAREASIPSILNKYEKYPKLFNFLYKFLYPKFDGIISQSVYMKNDLILNFDIKKENIEVINNPVDFEKIKIKMMERTEKVLFDKNKINMISVGSLEYVKGYDLLISAISKIKRNDICLYIIGAGSLEKELHKLITKLNLNEKIKLLGFKKNPYIYMKEANLAVLSSRYEGFPNTVLETLACGTPVVAFKCPGGVEEIILDNINGCFANPEDVTSLAKKIEQSIDIDFSSETIINSVEKRYNLNKIINNYEIMFMQVVDKN